MIYNSRSILYFFDLDGTILSTNWIEDGKIKDMLSMIKSRVQYSPETKRIEWSLLTERSDAFWLRFIINLKKLRCKNIVSINNSNKIDYKNSDIIAYLKMNKLKEIYRLSEIGKIKSIYYIDNDVNIVTKMNSMRDKYPIFCMTLKMFNDESFINISL